MESLDDYDVNISDFYLEELGEEAEYLLENPFVKFTMNLTVLIISGVVILANLLVIALIAKRWTNLSVVNVFILAIVCIELTSASVGVMIEPTDYLFKFPERNNVICKILFYASSVSWFLEPFMLAALLITLGLMEEVRLKTAVVIISATTTSGLILGIPSALSARSHHFEILETDFCIENWDLEAEVTKFKILSAIIEFLSYSLAVTVYLCKSKKLKESSERICRKMSTLLVLSVLFFLPTFLTKTIILTEYALHLASFPGVIIAVYILTSIGFGVKAVFFLFFHEDLRRDFEGLFSCFRRPINESYAIYTHHNS
jgi:hypothetical protein